MQSMKNTCVIPYFFKEVSVLQRGFYTITNLKALSGANINLDLWFWLIFLFMPEFSKEIGSHVSLSGFFYIMF